MRELVERGHIYIAQPPLYKAKQGKEESYLKDDHELNNYLLRVALKGAELVPGAGQPVLAAESLGNVAREYLLAEAVVARTSRAVDSAVLRAMLAGTRVDLSSDEAAERSARALVDVLADAELRIEPRYDAATETRRLVIVRTHHGTPHATSIDGDFLASGDGMQITTAADVLQGLIRPGAVVRRGDKQLAVKSFKEALDWLIGEARSSVTVQRYKGLGEMNPEQLWETTMDPSIRRLLKVQIEDTIASDEIFDKLMGEEVEPRRAFIEGNALGVRNLDV
jgi:DNA gyrase subunit B